MGRPTKLTPEVVKKLVESIELGSPYVLACNYAGISYDSFNEWRKKGATAKNGGKYAKFFETIKQAEGNATHKWLKVIEDSAQNENWVAAAWLLERRYPDNFGKQIRQKVESRNVNYDISELTEEQLKHLAETGDDSEITSNK